MDEFAWVTLKPEGVLDGQLCGVLWAYLKFTFQDFQDYGDMVRN